MPDGTDEIRIATAHNLSVLGDLFQEFGVEEADIEFVGRNDEHTIALDRLSHGEDVEFPIDPEDACGITVTGLQKAVKDGISGDVTRETCPPMRLDQALTMIGDTMLQNDFGGWDSEYGSEGRITLEATGDGLEAQIDCQQHYVEHSGSWWKASPAPLEAATEAEPGF